MKYFPKNKQKYIKTLKFPWTFSFLHFRHIFWSSDKIFTWEIHIIFSERFFFTLILNIYTGIKILAPNADSTGIQFQGKRIFLHIGIFTCLSLPTKHVLSHKRGISKTSTLQIQGYVYLHRVKLTFFLF